MAQLRFAWIATTLIAMGVLMGGCALFDGFWGGPSERESALALNDDGPLWPLMGKGKVKKVASACGRDLSPQEAKQQAQQMLQKAGGAKQLKALLEGKGKKLKLDKALGCKIKGKQKQNANTAMAFEVGIEQETAGVEEIGTLVEIPAGDDASLYINEVYEESESWASIKHIDAEGERLMQIETIVPEDYDLVSDEDLGVGEAPWFLPDETGNGELITEILEGLAEAGSEGFVFNLSAMFAELSGVDPAYRAFALEASDPELDWGKADAIIDEENEELVLLVPAVGTVTPGEALWGGRALNFFDDGNALVVRAPVRKVTRPATNTQRWAVERNVTTQKPVIRKTSRTRHIPEPFEFCPYQYYGRTSHAKKALCNTWEQKQKPKVNKVKFDSSKRSIAKSQQNVSQTLKLPSGVFGVSGKSKNLILVGFKELTPERIEKIYKADGLSSSVPTNDPVIQSYIKRQECDMSGENTAPETGEELLSTACTILGFFPVLQVGSAVCGLLATVSSYWQSLQMFEKAKLETALAKLSLASEGLSEAEVIDLVRNYSDNPNLPADERDAFRNFVNALGESINKDNSAIGATPHEIIGTAVFAMHQVFNSDKQTTTPDEKLGLSEFFQKMNSMLGPNFLIMLYYTFEATTKINWSVDNTSWEKRIPFKDRQTLKDFYSGLANMTFVNAEPLLAYITHLAAVSNKMNEAGQEVSQEVKEGLARAGFLNELAVEAAKLQISQLNLFYTIEGNGPVETVDFYFTTDELMPQTQVAVSHVYGLVEPHLAGADVATIFEKIKKVDNAIKESSIKFASETSGTLLNSTFITTIIIDNANSQEIDNLCERVKQQNFISSVVVVNGEVAQEGKCHSSRIQDEQARRLCDVTPNICRKIVGFDDNSTVGGQSSSQSQVPEILGLPPEFCGNVCFVEQ